MQYAGSQRKAYLSIDKILDAMKNNGVHLSTSQIAMSLADHEVVDELGTWQKYSASYSKIIAQKLDTILLRNLAMKCRGMLLRKSLKKKGKWQECFY